MKNIEYADICSSWKCNSFCPTCGAWKRDQITALSVNQIDHIKKSFSNLKTIVCEGGEPFLWNNLDYFCEVMHKQGRLISIITNGLAVQRIQKFADKFGPLNDRINFLVSLNGIGETHDISRGVKGAFDKTLESAKILRAAGFGVSFSYVPFQENIKDYKYIQLLGSELGIGIGLCYPCQSAKFGENMIWHHLDRRIVKEIRKDNMDSRPFPKNPRRWYNYFMAGWGDDYFTDNAIAQKIMPCSAGRKMMHINPEGIIRPCSMDESMAIGKVTDNGVDWTGLSKEHKARIPNVCQYESGDVCNACYIGYTVNRKPLTVLKWKLFG
jgi:radical SAM protein with 4Fe4S-binding SPASM domain